MSSSRVTLSPSYTKLFSSSIGLVAWPVQREGCRGEFQKKKYLTKSRKSQASICGLGINTLPSIFPGIYRKYIVNFYRRCRGHAIRELKKPRRRRRRQRRLKNEIIFYLRISRYPKVVYFVYLCQSYHETESRTYR